VIRIPARRLDQGVNSNTVPRPDAPPTLVAPTSLAPSVSKAPENPPSSPPVKP
jgi:hypothetical protein